MNGIRVCTPFSISRGRSFWCVRILLVVCLAFVTCSTPRAEESVAAISKQLMDPCENCKGKLLSACDCGPAAELKTEISALIAEGKDEQAVIAEIRAKHGDWILAAPEKKGFNLLGYALPFVLMLGGLGALLLFLRRASRSPHASGIADSLPTGASSGASNGAASSGTSPSDDVYRRKLRAEIDAFDRS